MDRQQLLDLPLRSRVEEPIQQVHQEVLMEQAGEEGGPAGLEVEMTAVAAWDVDQGVCQAQVEGVVGVVAQEQQVAQVEQRLAHRQHEH